MEVGEGNGPALGKGEHLTVDDVASGDPEERRHELGIAIGDAVERSGVELDAISGFVHLSADAVVLVLDDVGRRESFSDFLELQDRRGEHHPDRQEVRERRLGERPVLRAQRGLADVAGEHVRAPHRFAIAPERARDRLLEQSLSQSDSGLAAHDLHEVARLASGGAREGSAQEVALRGDAARGRDGVERLRDVGEGEWVSRRGPFADEVGRDVAEIGVPLVRLRHVSAAPSGPLEQRVGERAPTHGENALVSAGERRSGEKARRDLQIGVIERTQIPREGGVLFELLGGRPNGIGRRHPVPE